MDTLILLFGIVFWLVMLAGLFLLVCLPIAAMLGLPFWYRETWASWTSGTTAEAYERVAVGSTTGPIQIVPASYLFEKAIRVDVPAETARSRLVAHYAKAPFVKVLTDDDAGLSVDMRIPNGLGPGWVAVFVVREADGKAVVDARLRSTFCLVFPVLTVFLALTHHLHLERIVRQIATTDA
ncbi:MAG: hypothetical protein R3F61_06030 [Myxococcota bacterium]